jgi:hypothetical protein
MKTDPRKALENVRTDRRDLYKNVRALQAIQTKLEANLIFRITATQNTPPITGDHFSISQAVAPMTGLLNDLGPEYAGVRAILELALASEAFKEAAAEIEPLLAAIAALEAEEEKQKRDKALVEAELNQAREAAKTRALEAAENHPAVLAIKKKLQAFAAKF